MISNTAFDIQILIAGLNLSLFIKICKRRYNFYDHAIKFSFSKGLSSQANLVQLIRMRLSCAEISRCSKKLVKDASYYYYLKIYCW